MNNQQIIAFVSTADAAKARPFYEDILELKVQEVDEYGINFTAGNNYLRMSVVQDFKATSYAILSWVVTDIHDTIKQLAAKGVVFEYFEGLEQDKAGVWLTPDGTKVAWFRDPDQNILSLTQFK